MLNSRDITQKKHILVKMIFQSAPMTLKNRPRSPTSNQQFPLFKQCIYASLIKIHPLVLKITHINHILDISKTMKIRSRSPKSNLLFPFSHQCIFASLNNIHPLVLKTLHGNHILDISKCSCDLENKFKVTNILSTLSHFKQCI